MLKWVVGFILAVILSNLLGNVNSYWGPNLGLLLSGLVLGYWVHEGVLAGFFNAILSSILLSLAIVVIVMLINVYYGYGTVLNDLMSIIIILITSLLVRGFFMGIGGALGGFIANMNKKNR